MLPLFVYFTLAHTVSDRHASMTGPLANATCNVGSEGNRDVEEFLSVCHNCHVSAHADR